MPVIIGAGSGNGISINGSVGSSGQTIVSDGTNAAWSTPATGAFATGTLMLFQQTAAPTGWTKQTTHNDKSLRVVSGTASSGGTTAFTSVFTSRTPSGSVSGSNSGGGVDATTLAVTQIPSHTHTYSRYRTFGGLGPGSQFNLREFIDTGTGATGGSGSHGHGFTPPSWSGSFTGTALDFAVQYVDLIIASKN